MNLNCRTAKGRIISLLLFGCLSFSVQGQSLFDNALHTSKEEKKYTLNGFVRSSIFSDFKETKDVTADCALKLETKATSFGKAYVEARYKANLNKASDNEEEDELYLREAYCDLKFDRLDFRLGQQIIVWGRADGFNPTNNITPSNMTLYATDEDESRLENFVTRIRYNFQPYTLEFLWVPVYRATKIPVEGISFGEGVAWQNDDFPSTETHKSSYGVKVDIMKPSFDASVSFYDGNFKMPSLVQTTIDDNSSVFRSVFETKVLGADFSTVVGKYGLRGEFAYSMPDDDKKIEMYIPEKQLEYTLGLDREWGNFNIIAQYIGKHVIDFEEKTKFSNQLDANLYLLNTILFAQTDEFTHSMSFRPKLDMRQETISFEILSLVNFTTEEVYIKPLLEYKLNDDISLFGGAQLYYGPNDRLFGILEKSINSAFAEFKISF